MSCGRLIYDMFDDVSQSLVFQDKTIITFRESTQVYRFCARKMGLFHAHLTKL